jgi:hypothetical protein
MLLSRRISVHPAGAVIAAPPERRTVIAAIIVSPPITPGLGIVSDVERIGVLDEELTRVIDPHAPPGSPSPTSAALAAGSPATSR